MSELYAGCWVEIRRAAEAKRIMLTSENASMWRQQTVEGNSSR